MRVHGQSVYNSLKQATRDNIRAAGGLEAAASYPEMRCQKSSLGNYQNPSMPDSFIDIARAVDLMELTGNRAILHAMCRALGGHFCKLEAGDTEDIPSLIASVAKESSDVVSVIVQAWADSHYTPTEAKRSLVEVDEALQALTELRSKLLAIADAPTQARAAE